MYCIAILTDQEQEGQNCAEYIRNYCTEKKVFPLIEIYQDQEQFFERTRKTVPAVVFLALPGVSGLNAAEHLRSLYPKCGIIWCRSDLSDTSMMKLSTATGYIYGYVQNLETGMWQYIILDFETGETVFSMDVANKPMYNNMAIGMYAGNSGNALYCPTGYLELLRLQDRFVYLPEMPYRKVDLDQAMRNVLSQEKFAADGGQGDVKGWLNTITIENVHPNTTVAIRMKGISGETASLKLYAYGTDGTLKEVPAEKWHIQTEDGETPDTLSEDVLYEVHMTVEDGGDFDLSETEKEIKISAVLGI